MKIAALLKHSQCMAMLSENNLQPPTIPAGSNTVWRDILLADGRHAVIVNQTGFRPVASDNEEEINGLSIYIADEPPTPAIRNQLHRWIKSQLAAKPSLTNMNNPQPFHLTANDPLGAYESARPLLLKILTDKCDSSTLVRDIVWSLYSGHPAALNKIYILDQDRRDAVIALINLRMALRIDANGYLRDLLEESGEFARQAELQALAQKHKFECSDPITHDEECRLITLIDDANRKA